MPAKKAEAAHDRALVLLELARARFPELTKTQEKPLSKLFEAVVSGSVADYRAESGEDNDPAKATEWGDERVLKAPHIAWLCTDPEASALVTHRGIRVSCARFDKELALSDAKIPFPLLFWGSAFREGIVLQSASIRALYLLGTHTGPITADAWNRPRARPSSCPRKSTSTPR